MPKGKKVATGIYELSPGKYRIRVRVRGIDREDTHEGSLEGAKGAREALRRGVESGRRRDGRRSQPTASGYIDTWLDRKKLEVEPATLQKYTDALARALPWLEGLLLVEVEPTDIYAIRDGLAELDYAPRTVNTTLQALRTLFADAAADHRLDVLPTARVRALPEPPVYTDEAPGLLSTVQLVAFLEAAEQSTPGWAALQTTLAMTALRQSEATAIKVPDLDEAAEVIHIRRRQDRAGRIHAYSKTGRTRTVPLLPPLAEVLRAHRREMIRTQNKGFAQGWLFGSRRSRNRHRLGGPVAVGSVYPVFKDALAAAGLEGVASPHGLRRTLNDLLRRAAVPAEVQKAITGHSTEAMREHYSHVALEERREGLGEGLATVLRLLPRDGIATG